MNHEASVYDSDLHPAGYGESMNKKSVKLDSRQSNIEKIRIRKAKVSFFCRLPFRSC